MKLEDLRKGDYVNIISNNKQEYARIIDIRKDRVTLGNGVEYNVEEMSYCIASVEINEETLKKIGFYKRKCSNEYEKHESGCTFSINYNEPEFETSYSEDLGEIEALKTPPDGITYGTWTLECACISRIDQDKRTIHDIVHIHQLQHILSDYIIDEIL